MKALREKVFAGWPAEGSAIKPELNEHSDEGGLRMSDLHVRQPAGGEPVVCWWLQDPKVKQPEKVLLTVLDAESWTNSPAKWLWLGGGTPEAYADLRREMQAGKLALAFFAPRGVEPASGKRTRRRRTRCGAVTCCWARRSTA